MHIHLPKPLHGWREFVGEVGIIVLGVLIALGAEQIVETLHWRIEARDFRQAVSRELALNLGTFAVNEMQHACIRRRLDELDEFLRRSRDGEVVRLAARISGPVELSQYTSVWDNKDAQVVAHLPTETRLKYAQLYDEFRNTDAVKQAQTSVWSQLVRFEEPEPLTPGDRRDLYALIARARRMDATMEQNWPVSEKLGAALGVHPELQPEGPQLLHSISKSSLCRPMLKS